MISYRLYVYRLAMRVSAEATALALSRWLSCVTTAILSTTKSESEIVFQT